MLDVRVHSVMGQVVVSVRCRHADLSNHLLLSEKVNPGDGSFSDAVGAASWALGELALAVAVGLVPGVDGSCWG